MASPPGPEHPLPQRRLRRGQVLPAYLQKQGGQPPPPGQPGQEPKTARIEISPQVARTGQRGNPPKPATGKRTGLKLTLGILAGLIALIIIIGSALGSSGISSSTNTAGSPAGTAVSQASAASAAATPRASAVVLAAAPDRWGSRPPHRVTPGAGRHSLAAICPAVSAALEAARPSMAVRNEVFAEYGIPASQYHRYRIDHLVPLELDGSNSIRNLWPQLVGAARAKDRLENALHSMVCSGQITLASAQRAISGNWVSVYHKYVATPSAPSAAPAPAPAPVPAPATSAAAPPPASCYPTAASGNCYRPGEFCSTADHGMSGVAGDGEKIICEDNNGWRWEPA